MKTIISIVTTAVLFICAASAFAHGEASKPKHGGVIAKAEPLEAELVTAPTKLTLYMYDHGKPVDTKGATAKLTILATGKKQEVTLAPGGDNKLEGAITEALPKGARVVGVVSAGESKALSMRWAIK